MFKKVLYSVPTREAQRKVNVWSWLDISITKLGVVNSIYTIFAYNILAADRSLWQTSKHLLALHVKSRSSRRDTEDENGLDTISLRLNL